MPGDYSELERENKELRIAKNMLIDRVEATERELQEQARKLDEWEKEQKALRHNGQAQKAATEAGETEVKTTSGKSDRFFRRAEAVLYRIWVSFWTAVVCILLSISATVMLNAELREHVFGIFSSYFVR